MWVRNSTSKLAFISGMGRQPSAAPTHHTQSASVLSKTSTPPVLSAEPLCSYAQMTSTKLVIELSSTETAAWTTGAETGLMPCARVYPKASGKI